MKSQLELVRVSRETSRHRHRRHPSRRSLAQTERLLFFLGKPRTKGSCFALARLIVKYGCYITGQSGMQVQQGDSTAGAGVPNPQQPPIGCGLPGPYGGSGKHVCRYLYIAECLPSPLRKSHGSRLRFRATMEAGSVPVPTYTEIHTPLTKHAIITSCRVQAVVDQGTACKK